MRILALIPARGGSKRLPGKNIRSLGGKPLIKWSIDVAKNNTNICDILVSTDDVKIAEVSREAGALVPWLRPGRLATDLSLSVDVALHALDWYEQECGRVDGLLLLQPTSPFRTDETIRKGIDLYSRSGKHSVLGVSPTDAHPLWTLKIENDLLVPYLKGQGWNIRSQDLPPAYTINGSFYLTSPSDLRDTRSFIGPWTVPLISQSPMETLDIDTDWDWWLAESLLASQPYSKSKNDCSSTALS